MLAKLKSGIILSFIFFLLSLFSTAWGASGNVTITSPDPNQVYETATSFSVGGTYRMDSNDSGSIWVPAGDPSLPSVHMEDGYSRVDTITAIGEREQ